ncbi:MAG: HlyD family efflux transporter periplasmic adaptor subunit [candidate division Zixibacteria bacterium]|nr:HlyD family efflux transporter periplasmic adaptor subunit [candidate division Zixibacteria bacterium]
MDRELSTQYKRKKKLLKYSGVAATIIIIVISVMGFRYILGSSVNRSMIRTAVAEIGSIEASITASGNVVPEYEQIITSPIQSKIDKVFKNAGESIQAGQSILKLNQEFIMMAYDGLKDELKLKINRKSQLNLKLERSRIDLQAAYDIKELQTTAIAAKLEQEKHLYEIGAGTKVNLDQAQLNLEVSRRELEQLRKQIDNQQKSLEADLRELELQIRIQEKDVEKLEREIELAEAKADRDGVITWVNDDIGATINKGDVIARVADLGSFKIEANISDIHAAKLHVGNPVKIRIGGQDLAGEIVSIRPTIQNGIITFIVELEEKTNSSLRSNLRVDVFVITSFKDDVIRVANGPFANGSGPQDIFIVKGDKAIRKRVTIGATNFDYVEIESNVDIGDKVIISDMSDYIHRKELTVKNK